jgi:hypothetical protein
MASAPQFTITPGVSYGDLITANTNRDGTGTIVPVFSGSNFSGSRIEQIQIQATGSAGPGMIRFYYQSGSGGEIRLWREVPVGIVTASSTGSCFNAYVTFNPPMVMPTGSILYAAPQVGEAYTVFVYFGNF